MDLHISLNTIHSKKTCFVYSIEYCSHCHIELTAHCSKCANINYVCNYFTHNNHACNVLQIKIKVLY